MAGPALQRVIKYLGSKRRLVPLLTVAGRGRRRLRPPSTSSPAPLVSPRPSAAPASRSPRSTPPATPRCWPGRTWRGLRAPPRSSAARRGPGRARPPCRRSPATSPRRSAARPATSTPHNGARIDAIRAAIDRHHRGTSLEPVLLTSLLEAADRVDSTTGVQMAYLKNWAPRALRPLELRLPQVPAGPPGRGRAGRRRAGGERRSAPSTSPTSTRPTTSTATSRTTTCGRRSWPGTTPTHYGVACKRIDARDPATRSVVQRPAAHARGAADLPRRRRRRVVVLSYNDEAWLALDDLVAMVAPAGRGRSCWPSTRALRRRPDRHPRPRRPARWARSRTCATPSTSWWPAAAAGRGATPSPPPAPRHGAERRLRRRVTSARAVASAGDDRDR